MRDAVEFEIANKALLALKIANIGKKIVFDSVDYHHLPFGSLGVTIDGLSELIRISVFHLPVKTMTLNWQDTTYHATFDEFDGVTVICEPPRLGPTGKPLEHRGHYKVSSVAVEVEST